MSAHEPGAEYAGSAHLTSGADAWDVEVTLRGEFQPIDGRLHWWGRISADTPVEVRSGAAVVVRTPHGEATGKLSDVDPWGRPRLTGTGRPPF